MIRHAITVFAVSLALCVCGARAAAGTINISLVTVADPGNLPDPATGNGAVPYVYQMGEFDVTMSQYAAYLNSVATTGDPYGVYNTSMAPGYPGLPTYGITQKSSSSGYTYSVVGNGDAPVTDVNWGDAARFVNWLQNGQPIRPEGRGTTEAGTYALNGGTSDAALMAVSRSPTASWVLPTVNEWYKSAYYSGGGTNSIYWTYAMQSNTTPSNVLSATGTNNANFVLAGVGPPTFGATDPVNYVTPVGAFTASPSHYGTYDQSGDVWQLDETAISDTQRVIYGGSFAGGASDLESFPSGGVPPSYTDRSVGFRVAYVPEPSVFAMLCATAIAAFFLRRKDRPR
jgi:formylglycine-generating enzyme